MNMIKLLATICAILMVLSLIPVVVTEFLPERTELMENISISCVSIFVVLSIIVMVLTIL